MAAPIDELPTKTFDPYKLSEQGVTLEGSVPVSALKRVRDLLVKDEGSVSAVLGFGRDEENRRVVNGELEALIWVTCQRCLEPMQEHVRSRFSLAIVGDDDAAKQIPSQYEPLETHRGGGIKVRELVEDELLLAMSPFPMHPEQDCNEHLAAGSEADLRSEAAAEEGRRKPFELLEGLLNKAKDDSSRH
ncbi:YceD family protein [Hydrocarboniclastica marina]|mgnify:CR=1 FL=1|uniref:Large ribosomal RNA subunit accumulation protein YceD n=1 Tax=Hydrocarboniclastica marina TaxID=2259620 RepID=A0A4P7XF89_9ALTE|nr:YceD family protein [Hydrocarboniclastica marina]MAL98658.1 hypothetical protein [Alteromonadaceae bacterium]QCF25598.1 hypothetical protein soil367_06520 [Hydrocarboniclastica marina]